MKSYENSEVPTRNSQLHPSAKCILWGGLHPEWPFEYYLEIISAIKKHFPKLQIKAFTAVEVNHMAEISGLGLKKTLVRP